MTINNPKTIDHHNLNRIIMTDEKGNTMLVNPETYKAMIDTEIGNIITATDINDLFKQLEDIK